MALKTEKRRKSCNLYRIDTLSLPVVTLWDKNRTD